MNPQHLPATMTDDSSSWRQTVMAFLAEKERRSGSRRTVEGYADHFPRVRPKTQPVACISARESVTAPRRPISTE